MKVANATGTKDVAEDFEVVGLDLGDGESALALTRLLANPKTEPQPLEVDSQRTIITAVGVDDKDPHRIFIGKEVFTDAPGKKYVRFKNPQLDGHPEHGRALRLYVRGLVDRLAQNNKQLRELQRARFYVGCPSGWKPAVQDAYQRLLCQEGLPHVRVVPESRAAFMHARQNGISLSTEELTKRVLLIDVGSSTTDFTYSIKLNTRPIDFGHTEIGDIGGGQIDQLILDQTIASQRDRQAVWNFLAVSPGKMSEFNYKCRQVMEEYFSSYVGKGITKSYPFILDDDLIIKITVTDQVMEILLATPVPSLGGLSWKDAFADRLRRVKAVPDMSPDYVIVTGGAARMSLVDELVARAFPEAKVVRGGEPELAIAKGLAWFGHAELRAEKFREEVETLCAGPAIKEIVAAALPQLYPEIAKILAREMRKVISEELLSWRSGDVRTLRRMEQRIKDRVASFASGVAARKAIEPIAKNWFVSLCPKVHKHTGPICDRYGQPADLLDIAPDTHFAIRSDGLGRIDLDLEGVGVLISAVIATIVAMVIGGTGLSVLALPLIGQIIAGVLVFVGLRVGFDAIQEKVKDWDLPQTARWLLTDNKIKKTLDEAETTLIKEIENRLATDAALGQKLAEQIAERIAQALRQRAEDAILRF